MKKEMNRFCVEWVGILLEMVYGNRSNELIPYLCMCRTIESKKKKIRRRRRQIAEKEDEREKEPKKSFRRFFLFKLRRHNYRFKRINCLFSGVALHELTQTRSSILSIHWQQWDFSFLFPFFLLYFTTTNSEYISVAIQWKWKMK